MALTAAERKSVETAELEKLTADLMKAMRENNSPGRQAALDALLQFSTRATDPELAQGALDTGDAVAGALMKEGLAKLRKIAGEMAPLTAVFADAANIAKTGKKELFIPRLAATAATLLETVTAIKEAADKVKTEVDSIDELGDVPDALDKVVAALENLQNKATSLQ